MNNNTGKSNGSCDFTLFHTIYITVLLNSSDVLPRFCYYTLPYVLKCVRWTEIDFTYTQTISWMCVCVYACARERKRRIDDVHWFTLCFALLFHWNVDLHTIRFSLVACERVRTLAICFVFSSRLFKVTNSKGKIKTLLDYLIIWNSSDFYRAHHTFNNHLHGL